jgi:predicted DNA-binding mobile mystery protein A
MYILIINIYTNMKNQQRFLSRLEYWVESNKAAWPEILSQKSWLRNIRKAQGVKGLDLAKRLGVSPARVSVMERDEQQGAVTLKMMQKAAQALECEFVYLLVPKKSLPESVGLLSQKPKIRVQQQKHED